MRPSLLSIDAPRTRRRVSPIQGPRLSLDLREVVLHGFERANRDQIRNALQQSLTASLQRGAPPFAGDVNLSRTNARLDVRPGAPSSDIGAQIAGALAQALERAARGRG
jgi:hypothetical protein